MRYFYYMKTAEADASYQDEQVSVPKEVKDARLQKEESGIEVSKSELLTEVASHKISKYDENEQVKEVDAKDAETIVRWDGVSPFYELISGEKPESIPYVGWPQIEKEDYLPEEPNPIDVPLDPYFMGVFTLPDGV